MEKENSNEYKENLLNKSDNIKDKLIEAVVTPSTPEEKTSTVPDGKKAASFFQLQYALSKKFDVFIVMLAFIGSVGMGFSMPLFSIIFGGTINDFGPSAQQDPEQFIETIRKMCLKFLFVGLGVWFVSFLNIWLWTYNGRIISKRLKKKYFSLLMQQEQGYFDTKNIDEFATKIQTQIKTIEMGIGDKIGNSLMAVAMAISSFSVGFSYSWKLTLVLISILPLLLISGFLLVTGIRNSDVRKAKAYEKAGGIAEEIIKNIKTVASFANFDYEKSRFQNKLEESYTSGVKGGLVIAISLGILYFAIFGSYALAIWFGSRLISEKEINTNTGLPFQAGDVLTVLFTVVFGAMSLGQASPNIKSVSEAMTSAYDFFELLKRVPNIKGFSKTKVGIKEEKQIQPEKESIKGRVEFKNVTFFYPSKPETSVLDNLNLTFEENKTTAIVGTSGSGKSTIANLIERLYEINQGQIFLDTYDTSEIKLDYLRSLIGYVPQEPVLFNTTIRDNIIFGRENISDEMVWSACKQAMADEFITQKEEGLDYVVGLKGSKLSGGQKQRIAIARAILMKPKILILDEATSALDNKCEKEVQRSLNKVSLGVTTIVIAHRLSTVINADKIIVLHNGKIIEEGRHQELLKLDGAYSNLIKNQIGIVDFAEDLEDERSIRKFSVENKKSNDVEGDTGNLITDSAEVIPRLKLQRKNSSEELEDQIAAEKKKKLEFENLANQKRGRIIPILKERKGIIFWTAIFTALSGAVWPIYGIILADSVTQLSNPDSSVVKDDGLKLAIYFLILAGVAGISVFFQNVLFTVIGEHMTRALRRMTFAKYLRLHMGYFDVKSNTPGYLITKLSSDTTKTNSVAFSMVGTSIQTVSTLTIGVTLGFIYDWRLSLINLAIVPLTVFSGVLQYKIQQGYSNVDEVVDAAAGSIVSESVSNTKTIYCYNMQGKVVRMYNSLLKSGIKTIKKRSILNGFIFGFSQFVMYGTYSVIYYAGGSFMYQGTLTMDNMFRAIFSLLFAGFGLGQAQIYLARLSEAKTALVNIFMTIDEKSLIDPVEISERTPPALKQEIKGKIEFRNVTFKYTESGPEVLKNLSFVIEPGMKTAFVGASGSGKSTIVQLIERFYDVTDGQILIDDVDIREYDLTWLRHNLSCVMQEPVLFQTSIQENIRYGKLEANDQEIVESANKANIAHKLEPNSNINVSGGEKQRLALARAVINKPKVLLLDEFTSALNSNLEREILVTLEEMNSGITTITIAHRLSTIENSDMIFVMEDGVIIEKGDHKQLYQAKGKYRKLYDLGQSEMKNN